MQRDHIILAGGLLGGLLLGGSAGYILAEKRLEKHYEEQLKQELVATKEFYRLLYKQDEFETPEQATAALGVDVEDEDEVVVVEETEPVLREAVEAMTNYQGRYVVQKERRDDVTGAPVASVEDRETGERNIFVGNKEIDDEEWDYDFELARRTSETPYIISFDEYMEAATGFDQLSITYYEGDDTLTDSEDKPVDDIDRLVGPEALSRFGHGAMDKNVVYVRNEMLEIDYEITKSKGKYTREVLGFIKDSESRGSRRFRDGDDE